MSTPTTTTVASSWGRLIFGTNIHAPISKASTSRWRCFGVRKRIDSRRKMDGVQSKQTRCGPTTSPRNGERHDAHQLDGTFTGRSVSLVFLSPVCELSACGVPMSRWKSAKELGLYDPNATKKKARVRKSHPRKPRVASPAPIRSNFLVAQFCLLGKKLAIGVSAECITLREAKRLHAWLGRAIQYLEWKESRRGE